MLHHFCVFERNLLRMPTYRGGGGGSRCAVVTWVTEALRAGQTGSSTVVSSLTQPAVLCSITARLVRVGTLDC